MPILFVRKTVTIRNEHAVRWTIIATAELRVFNCPRARRLLNYRKTFRVLFILIFEQTSSA